MAEQFRFNGRRASNSENSSINEVMYQDIHPMELTAQSIIGPSLDKLNNSLNSLHESQIVLLTRLKNIEERLLKFNELTNGTMINLELQHALTKINGLKKRLTGINNSLEIVHERTINFLK